MLVIKTVQPIKPKVFSIQPFTEKTDVEYNSEWSFKYKPYGYKQRSTYVKNPQISIIDMLVIKEWHMISVKNVGTMEKHNERMKLPVLLPCRDNLLQF